MGKLQINGDLTLVDQSSRIPTLTWIRGTSDDTYTDWRIQAKDGNLYFQHTFNEEDWMTSIQLNEETQGGTIITPYSITATGGFNGNATSASKWANTRTLTLTGDTNGSVSFDGSGNMTLTSKVRDVGLVNGFQTSFRTSIIGSAARGPFISVIRSESAISGYTSAYGTGLAFGRQDTHGYIYLNYSTNQIFVGAGSGDALQWVKQLSFSDHTHNYLPLSGGTIAATTSTDTPLSIKSGDVDAYIRFEDKNGTILGYYGVTANHQPVFYYGGDKILLHSDNYSSYALPLSGGTMTGALNFANGTWNLLGDDVYFGDNNISGAFCIKGANGTTNLRMTQYGGTASGSISWDGSAFTFSNYIYGSISNASYADELKTTRTIFGQNFNGSGNVAGRAYFNGYYTSSAGERYHCSAIEIRENDLVTNSQSDIGYAPAIGFHWGNRCAGTLCYNGIFHFKTQSWERATIDANLNGWASSAGNASTCNGTQLEWAGSIAWGDTAWIAAWNSDGSKIKALSKDSFAPASHSHSYLPLSGGTISGRIAFSSHTWTSAPDVDNAVLNFGYAINSLTSSTHYSPWFGGAHGISSQGYYATAVAGMYHTNAASRGGFYIGMSWDMNAADTYYYFARDGHFITNKLVISSNYGSTFPTDVYIGEIFFQI